MIVPGTFSMRMGLRQLTASNKFPGFVGAAFAVFVVAAERDLRSLPFVLVCGAFVAALAFALSTRPRFSIFMALAVLTLSTAISMAKFKMVAMNAHVFDLWFHLSNLETMAFLGSEYSVIIFAAVAALAVFAALACWVWRADQPVSLQRWRASGVTLCCAAALPFAIPREANDFFYHIRTAHFMSSFFASFSDLARLSEASPIASRLARARTQAPFTMGEDCNLHVGAPDIILTLSESAVPPATIPGWKYDPSLQDYFKSWDGEVRRARVETHGNGTWVAHTTVNSGLSMADYGWMRPYSTMLLRDRLHHGLPAALAKCGYRTAFITPLNYRFVNEGPMLTSLGFMEYLDRQRLAAPTRHESDAFYFSKALEFYKRHIAEDKRPLFLFILTMAAHSPYDFRHEPDRKAKGEPFGNGAETDEYLRRLTFAQEDYAQFRQRLAAFKRPILAAEFGDHHPVLTREAFARVGNAQDLSNFRSKLYETFYAVAPINFTPKAPLPNVATLDLAFLGVTLLHVAGVPLDPVFQDKYALRALCEGAFHTCEDRGAVDRHLRRMNMTGLIIEPGEAPRVEVTTAQQDP